jgi:type IV pilus assembly protein PilV
MPFKAVVMTKSRVTPAIRTRGAGFSLVEVLVTVAIVAIALVGIAATQLVGLRGNQGAYYVTQATYAAYEAADLLRANRGGVLAGALTTGVVAAWRDHVRNLLPEGDLQMQLVNPARNEVRIVVSWLDEKQAIGPTAGRQEFVLVTRI